MVIPSTKNNRLNGFGRYFDSFGNYRMGWFQDGQLHGFGQRINKMGDVEVGLFQNNGKIGGMADYIAEKGNIS